MSTSKHLNRVCAVILVLCLAVTFLLYFPDFFGIEAASKTIGYESRLFDTSKVHTIDIVMDDWDEFIENCENEEYSACAVVIDGESYKNVALRAKGNTSLSQVAQYGNDRYSFKLEFDHYSDALNYHGLDKLCLNNIIQDNTHMKDYLCYTMMSYAGVNAPLCSFAYITVNGEDWGLYLAVEAIEDGFLERNYNSTGNLYKPDSISMGGGRGNGKDFEFDSEDIKNFKEQFENSDVFSAIENSFGSSENFSELKEKFEDSETLDDLKDLAESIDFSKIQDNFTPDNGNQRENGHKGGFGGAMGSDDVKLVYTDDDFDSYSNIFDNAKTDISDSDKERLINSLKTLSTEDASSTVDIEKVISYFAVHNFVCNFDSYTGSMIHNYYLYEKDGILSMIPWDYNLAFGTFQGGESNSMINYPIDSPVSGGDTDSRPMISWIFDNEEYTELYHTALSEFIAEYFESGYFEEEFERVNSMIAPYVEKDPTKFCTYDEFTEGSAALNQFCLLRAESVRGQLDGSIPSTSEGQSADSSALIDGSAVKLNLMGSMGGGGFGGGFNPPDNANNGGFGEMPDMSNMDFGNFTPPDSDGQPPEMPDGENNGFTPPDMPQENSENAEGSVTNEVTTVPPTENEQETTDNPESDGNSKQDKAERNNKPQEMSEREHTMPDNFGQQESNNDTLILLGVSAAALLIAIILTKLFKDRI